MYSGQFQKIDLSTAQEIACPVCKGSGNMPQENGIGLWAYTPGMDYSYPCACCNGKKRVLMTAGGALFPLSARPSTGQP